MAWNSRAWLGTAQHGTARHSMARHGTAWHGRQGYPRAAVRCGVCLLAGPQHPWLQRHSLPSVLAALRWPLHWSTFWLRWRCRPGPLRCLPHDASPMMTIMPLGCWPRMSPATHPCLMHTLYVRGAVCCLYAACCWRLHCRGAAMNEGHALLLAPSLQRSHRLQGRM